MMVLQVLQILRLVLSQRRNNLLVLQQRKNLLALLLELVQRREDLLPLVGEFSGHVVRVVDFGPEAGGVVHHVCGLHEIEFCLHKVVCRVHVLLGQEFEEREDEMSVQEGHELLRQVVLLSLPRVSPGNSWGTKGSGIPRHQRTRTLVLRRLGQATRPPWLPMVMGRKEKIEANFFAKFEQCKFQYGLVHS